MAGKWKIGDRVSLCPNGRESSRDSATVIGVDNGSRPGVEVRLDHSVAGIDTAYATHDELQEARFFE